jgi:hypothetical protein
MGAAETATAFGVPAGSIKKRNIRIADRPNSAQNPTELFCTTSGKSVIYGLGPEIWSPTNAPRVLGDQVSPAMNAYSER